MLINKRKITLFLATIITCSVALVSLSIYDIAKQRSVARAVSSFPTQLGLLGVTQIQCTTSCCTPVCSCCTGGTLCMTKDVATCTTYKNVSGTMAGGSANAALFSVSMLGSAGVQDGGQLMAGCMSPTMCDSGVLAGAGGCTGTGCAKRDVLKEMKDIVMEIFIAGDKD